ncbi:MAG: hypothetical protein WD335_02680 [Candidatus Paceibacterota bacterium]
MPGFLEQLRNKSPETRKRFALGTSATVTGVIFVMWLTVFNHGPYGSEGSLQNTNIAQTQTASPLSAFSDNAASAFQEFRDHFASDSATTSSATTSTTSDSEVQPATRTDGSYQPVRQDDSPNSYWADQRSRDVGNEQNEAMGPQVQGDRDDKREPFHSRNYNPNQDGEWFSQD